MNGTTYRPATGDFNDDGRHDIFWHNPGSATDYIWNGNTTKGTFTMGAAANQLAGTHEPVAEDFDGDGFDDVFFYGPGTEPDEIHYGTATSFMLGVETGVDVSGTYTASAGDFDGDGHGDVYWYTEEASDPDFLWYGTPTRATFDGIVDAPSVSYAYDGDGLRQSKTIELLGVETTTTYTWDTSAAYPLLLAETTDGDTTRYLYGPGGSPYAQHNADGTITYLRHDQLGSTRLLTDEAGAEVGSYTYDPYGQVTDQSGAVSTPFGYAGEYTDTETGFQYLRARYYDPTTGVFLTKDPISSITREPYGYVAGNPLNATDPTGLYWGEGLVERAVDVGVAVVNAPVTAVTTTANVVTGGDCRMGRHLTTICEGGALSDLGDTAFTSGNTVNVTTDYVSFFNSHPEVLEHEWRHSRQWAVLGYSFLAAYYTNYALSDAFTGGQCWNVFESEAGFDDGHYPCKGFGKCK